MKNNDFLGLPPLALAGAACARLWSKTPMNRLTQQVLSPIYHPPPRGPPPHMVTTL